MSKHAYIDIIISKFNKIMGVGFFVILAAIGQLTAAEPPDGNIYVLFLIMTASFVFFVHTFRKLFEDMKKH